MRGQLTGREWLGRVGGAPTTAEPRIGWGARCGDRGCGLGDRSTTQPQVLFCDQGAQRLMLVTSQKRSVSPPTRRARTRTRDRICPCPVGMGWVGTGLAPGGFAGMACL
jgi:hypothetical protein